MRPLIVIVLIILGLFAYKTYYLDAEDAPKEVKTTDAQPAAKKVIGLPVDIYVAQEVKKSNVVFASGTVVPNEEVEIRSEVSGRLIELHINEGGYIKKGAVIAKLNDSDLRSQLKKLDFEEQLAEQTAARQEKLLEINAISKEEYDMAVNKVNTLSADKEFLQVQLEKTTIHAPFSGKMGLKNISEGAYITSNTIISQLIQSNPVKLDFSVPEKYANRIKRGQEITFTIDGDDENVTARIIALDPMIDEDLRTLRIRAKASNHKGKYLPGMFIKVALPLGEVNSIMIPTESIIPILKGKKVFVMKNGKASEVLIKTGLRTDTKVQVEEGLVIGDSVVVSALMSVKNGTPISVRTLVE
ncbi:MAG: membrane fusion protein (multidrug efflux system) [Saprospiraceae bacterium]|jgi:membrane fusion protein (multidrug efflux system)